MNSTTTNPVKNMIACLSQTDHQRNRLAGTPRDFILRSFRYLELYQLSNRRNHFALIAAFGALWADRLSNLLETTSRILSFIPNAYIQHIRHDIAHLIHSVGEINRQVYIHCYEQQIANKFSQNQACPQDRYSKQFKLEQDTVVHEPLAGAIADCKTRTLRYFVKHLPVYFEFLPLCQLRFFTDFSNKQERIARGTRYFQYAQTLGFDQVELILRKRLVRHAKTIANSGKLASYDDMNITLNAIR